MRRFLLLVALVALSQAACPRKKMTRRWPHCTRNRCFSASKEVFATECAKTRGCQGFSYTAGNPAVGSGCLKNKGLCTGMGANRGYGRGSHDYYTVSKSRRVVSFRSYNYPRHYIRHAGFLGYISSGSATLFKRDASWVIVKGLYGSNTVSLRSTNYPSYYLRHAGFRVRIGRYSSATLLKKDASWYLTKSLIGHKSFVSFRSVNYPNRYIRHRSYQLWLDNKSNAALYKKDASFLITNPLYKNVCARGQKLRGKCCKRKRKLPGGSYGRSCKACRKGKGVLSCFCKTRRGRWRFDRIVLKGCNKIHNINGHLKRDNSCRYTCYKSSVHRYCARSVRRYRTCQKSVRYCAGTALRYRTCKKSVRYCAKHQRRYRTCHKHVGYCARKATRYRVCHKRVKYCARFFFRCTKCNHLGHCQRKSCRVMNKCAAYRHKIVRYNCRPYKVCVRRASRRVGYKCRPYHVCSKTATKAVAYKCNPYRVCTLRKVRKVRYSCRPYHACLVHVLKYYRHKTICRGGYVGADAEENTDVATEEEVAGEEAWLATADLSDVDDDTPVDEGVVEDNSDSNLEQTPAEDSEAQDQSEAESEASSNEANEASEDAAATESGEVEDQEQE